MSGLTIIEDKLEKGIRALGLDLPIASFLDYLSLLYKWNQVYNLTAVRDLETMVTRHILDSLAILPWVKEYRVLDVGSGAGLPGIPLALACHQFQVVLLDSNGKKIRFLQEVKRILSLEHVEIVQTRVENYHPGYGFDTVISRAFSDLGKMVNWTHHLIATDGIWLAMKGRCPDTELNSIKRPFRVENYPVPGVEGQRCCVIIEKE
ncbi:16S rRNA (guanine(527)-N(7))-methyltransferase RsmG [Legionella nagasakiensis]|uniref:16S rRNA (guanine(527)-N(7))-methyltransferase RsmG n=1 Tax=Legionella nagasakiensis TaxID=535290 RepID=UPI0010561F33|nr:16S rRNA (guanine(527)-N(7))-methyltransferase RsmG [Legionella nagasakiensis]